MSSEQIKAVDFSQGLSPERQRVILAHAETETRRIFEEMPLLPVHDITHVERVVKNTKAICEGEKTDSFLPEIAAWLHDIGRLQEIQAKEKGEKIYHAEASAEQVPAILESFKSDLGQEAIRNIQGAVSKHSLKNSENDSQLTVILMDADRLDGIGAIGFPRVFAFYPERPIYNPQDPFGGKETSEEYLRYSGQSSQIQAFYRNMEWFGWMRTKTGIRLAVPRIKLMKEFLYQLADELDIPKEKIDEIPVVKEVENRLVKLDKV